jgi:hypothetical protein
MNNTCMYTSGLMCIFIRILNKIKKTKHLFGLPLCVLCNCFLLVILRTTSMLFFFFFCYEKNFLCIVLSLFFAVCEYLNTNVYFIVATTIKISSVCANKEMVFQCEFEENEGWKYVECFCMTEISFV